jgi:hypothetical protein
VQNDRLNYQRSWPGKKEDKRAASGSKKTVSNSFFRRPPYFVRLNAAVFFLCSLSEEHLENVEERERERGKEREKEEEKGEKVNSLSLSLSLSSFHLLRVNSALSAADSLDDDTHFLFI